MSDKLNRIVVQRFAEIADEYQERSWKITKPDWIIAGTCGLTIGDLMAARKAHWLDRWQTEYQEYAFQQGGGINVKE